MTAVQALVLPGGGARSAYQAGALQAISDLLDSPARAPFEVLTGTSAGALNAIYLASRVNAFARSVSGLAELWSRLTTKAVYRTDMRSLARIGLHWLSERSLGGFKHSRHAVALLDTAPLRELLERHTDPAGIALQLASGRLRGVAINAVDYCCGINRTFFQGSPGAKSWSRSRRRGQPAILTLDHLMASTAIPVLFPPIEIEGHYYGDGAVRNYAPLSSAIKFGATRLLVIAVRRTAPPPLVVGEGPSLGRIVSVLLNSVLLDGVDLDLERLEAVNRALLQPGGSVSGSEGQRRIEALVLRPSEDLGQVALEETHHLPATMRYVLRGLGSQRESSDLASYLLFEPPYCTRLFRMGYDDTLARETEVRAFLSGSP